MKIAITTSGNDLNAPLDSRFGRAPKFLIYDLEAKTFEIIDNEQNLNAAQGAGIQSAQNIARLGAKALVTGHCGPKAFRVLGSGRHQNLQHFCRNRIGSAGTLRCRQTGRGDIRRR